MKQLNGELKVSAIGLILTGIAASIFGVVLTFSVLFFAGVAFVVTYGVVIVVRAFKALGEYLKGDQEL